MHPDTDPAYDGWWERTPSPGHGPRLRTLAIVLAATVLVAVVGASALSGGTAARPPKPSSQAFPSVTPYVPRSSGSSAAPTTGPAGGGVPGGSPGTDNGPSVGTAPTPSSPASGPIDNAAFGDLDFDVAVAEQEYGGTTQTYANLASLLATSDTAQHVVAANVVAGQVNTVSVLGAPRMAVLAVAGGGGICVFVMVRAPQNEAMYDESSLPCTADNAPVDVPGDWSTSSPS